MKTISAILLLLIVSGCTTFYNTVVTVTEVRKNTLTELAVYYKQGLISKETDAKIEKADQEFLKAASVLELSLQGVKASQNAPDKAALLSAVKAPVLERINILATYSLDAANKNQNNLTKANQL